MLILIRRFITHNWILKVFSLVLATLMWFAIWSGSNDQMSRIVSVGFRDIPENMEITGETDVIPVTLQLRGSFDLLAGLATADITPTISLAGHEPGPKSFVITPDNIDTPPGVEVFGVNPDRVVFNLERTIQKEVEIQPNVEGNPAAGFFVAETSVTPPSVVIRGPESSIDPIAAISTAAIRIDGSSDSIMASVNLDVPDPKVRMDSFAPVQVTVRILEDRTASTLDVRIDPTLAEEWEVDTPSVSVTFTGPVSEMEAFTGEGVYFGFDATRIGEDGAAAPVIAGLPNSFEVVAVSPETIDVTSVP